MKSHTEHLWLQTEKRIEFINLTPRVEEILRASGVQEGLVLVNAMHITAAVYINDAEPGLIQDYREWLEELVDTKKDYRHNLTGEDNGDAHHKREIMGRMRRSYLITLTAGA